MTSTEPKKEWLKRRVMGLVNSLYELAELQVVQRQNINDKADGIAVQWAEELLLSRDEALVAGLEGMKRQHREFECNGANNGRGCFESWCDMAVCVSQEALACRNYNAALNEAIALIRSSREGN